MTNETAIIRALLREGLPTSAVSSLASHNDVSSVEIERVHFSAKRPIQLQLTLHGDSGWRQSLIAEWLGSEADAHAQRERRSLRKSRRAQLPRDDTNGIVVLPEWGLVVRRPGLDSKLPGLRLFHNPDEAARLLTSLDKTIGDKVKVELVAHRLGKRAVLRISTAANVTYYVRLRGISSRSGSVSYSRHQALFNDAQSRTEITLPRPLGYNSELGAAVFSELEGTPAEYGGTSDLSQCRMIGQALHAFQSIDCASLPKHTSGDEYAILSQLYDRTQRYFPELALSLRGSMDELGVRLRQSHDTSYVLSHRDLHLNQLLMTDSCVGILDFDTLCRAHPAVDLGNLQAHVYLESQRAGFDSAPLESALSCALRDISTSQISLWRCSALLRLVMIYVFTDEPRTTINALIEEVSSCHFA